MIRQQIVRHPWLGILLVTVLAGLLYSSWPLGYWLNPIANHGLASDLEATHQPYNWVFIALDILSGVLVCLASWWLLKLVKKTHLPLLKYAVIGFAAFGLLTAIDALLPINCVSQCGSVLDDPSFIIHGIVSVGSIVGLTVSLMSVWWLMARGGKAARSLRWLLHGTMLLWFGFGWFTAILIWEARSSALSQHLFITVCSLWMALLPYLAWRALTINSVTVNAGKESTVSDLFSDPPQPISRRRKPHQAAAPKAKTAKT